MTKKIKYIVLICINLTYLFACAQVTQKSPVNYESEINDLLNGWHHAATVADELIFFESMDEACIYIGTDSSERWTKNEFQEWGKNIFERDTAWNFVPFNRNIIISEDGNYAWFDELLETWMGTCRGSGIVKKDENEKWRIMQYHLSVTVPNEKIRDFISLINK